MDGTKKIDRISAINIPMALQIPNSLIIVRYAPNTKETKPIAVVTDARITGMVVKTIALINVFLLSLPE